jgi:heme A synthase
MSAIGPLDVVKFLHAVGARALVVFAVVLALWGTYHYIRKRDLPSLFRRAYLGLFGLTALQGLLGLLAFALGDHPTEFVHIAYGIFALIFLPGAYISSSPRPHRNETLILAVALWIVSVAYVRGIVTG